MSIIKVQTNYYQQFDADYSLDVPAEGYGGWKEAELELNLDKTGIVLMHSMHYGKREDIPGLFRACEWLPRAYEMGEKVIPGLIRAARDAGIKVIHVAGGKFDKNHPGYRKVLELAGKPKVLERIETDTVLDGLLAFKRDNGFPGVHNLPSYVACDQYTDFVKNTYPLDDEAIVENEDHMIAVCREYGLNHLIYVGYNINWCVMFASGGFMHIYRNGILCSTIRQAVTAVENKESARTGMGKEIALWTIAVGFGFVYDLDDFIQAIRGADTKQG